MHLYRTEIAPTKNLKLWILCILFVSRLLIYAVTDREMLDDTNSVEARSDSRRCNFALGELGANLIVTGCVAVIKSLVKRR